MLEASSKIPILLVDDRPENLLALKAVLAKPEYELVEVQSGIEALEYLKEGECAVILLDVQMPVMDGFETAFRIRRDPKTSSTPIIFITASMEDNERLFKGYEAGAVDYIFKPFEPLILRSKVSVFVDLYKAKKEIERQNELIRLQENQERDSFLEYALDAVIGMNEEGIINYWNLKAIQIFGRSKDEAFGIKMSDLIKVESYGVLKDDDLEKYEATGIGPILRKRIEVMALHKNGFEFPLELTVIPIRSRGKIHFSAFARDISSLKKAEKEKKTEEEKLTKALHARDEFISICSHELKTPVTSMKLQFQLTAKQLERNDPNVLSKDSVLKRVKTSNTQLDRMARLIDDMLDVSRITSGKLLMQMGPVFLQEIVEEVLERFSDQLNNLKIQYNFIKLENKFLVNGDSFRLEQVITNLLTNAIKYGEGRSINLELKAYENSLHFIVMDNGLGIHKDHIDIIFDRYERAIPSNNISGLGLGLYITKQIIEAHKGHIFVESELSKGSTFRIELPLMKS